jgi:hypothetical protein
VSRSTQDLAALLDQLEDAVGAPDAVPSRDGWELVLAENIAYLAGTSAAGKRLRNSAGWSAWRPSGFSPRCPSAGHAEPLY